MERKEGKRNLCDEKKRMLFQEEGRDKKEYVGGFVKFAYHALEKRADTELEREGAKRKN